MTDDQILETILTSSFVKADVMRRIRIIREYLEQRFFTPEGTKDLPEFFKATKIAEEDQGAINAWGKDFFTSFTKENAYDLIEHVLTKVKDLPTVNLYVPMEVSPEEAPKLGAWFRRNVGSTILIEVHVEPTTFGGCAFAWNGVYYDFSLRHYMHNKMTEIRKVLTDYGKAGQTVRAL